MLWNPVDDAPSTPSDYAPYTTNTMARECNPLQTYVGRLFTLPSIPRPPPPQAYAVLGDPKERKKYDRDGHPPSAGGSARGAANSPTKKPATAPTAPSAPPAPVPAPAVPTPPSSRHVPQHAPGGWGPGGDVAGGGWEGVPVNGGYGQGWVSLSLCVFYVYTSMHSR